MKIYVVRHGETNMGKNKVIATEEEPLNENGIQQAILLGEKLRNKKIDIVYCSTIQRAHETLRLFDLDESIPVILEDRIKERNMGIYENTPFDRLDWKEFWGINSEKKYTELESMKSVYERVSKFLEEIKIKEKDKNILIVSHGGVIRTIDWYFNGFYDKMFECENCKIYEYNL